METNPKQKKGNIRIEILILSKAGLALEQVKMNHKKSLYCFQPQI